MDQSALLVRLRADSTKLGHTAPSLQMQCAANNGADTACTNWSISGVESGTRGTSVREMNTIVTRASLRYEESSQGSSAIGVSDCKHKQTGATWSRCSANTVCVVGARHSEIVPGWEWFREMFLPASAAQ